MRERVFSLETEYAIAFQTQGEKKLPSKELIVKALRQPLIERCGIPDSWFLVNGSKFHPDQGHAEWSLPECRSAYEAVVYDKAADLMLGSIIADAEHFLSKQGFQGHLLIVKNNVDADGNTYGCHENYLTERQTQWLSVDDYLWLTARYLIPFLVTRQVFCGAGRVGFGQELEEGVGFQLMQRADFIEEVVSHTTTRQRAILSLAREDEPLAEGNYRRLHLILADTNMSGWATYLKLGTTGIVLRMLEDMGFGDIPHLLDPLKALRQISRDPTCTMRVPLQDGRELTAVEIQRFYLTQAKRYLNNHPSSEDEKRIIRLWEDALNQLATDPMQLSGKVDWVTKKSFMERYLQSLKMQWEEVSEGEDTYYQLLRLDILYHNLSSQDSLFYRLLKGKPDTLISIEEIQKAQSSPPPYTRAWIRGIVIAASRELGLEVEVDKWSKLRVNGRSVPLGKPLQFFSPELYAIISDSKALQSISELTDDSQDELESNENVYINLGDFLPLTTRATRGYYNIVIYSLTANVASRLNESLVALGYTPASLRTDPNPEFNIKWGGASSWFIEEIIGAICEEFELDINQIYRQQVFELDERDIYINLGGVIANHHISVLPVEQNIDCGSYILTILSSDIDVGEQLADELSSLGYRIDIVMPSCNFIPEFSIRWGRATEVVVDEITSQICRKFGLNVNQVSGRQELDSEDTRIFITLCNGITTHKLPIEQVRRQLYPNIRTSQQALMFYLSAAINLTISKLTKVVNLILRLLRNIVRKALIFILLFFHLIVRSIWR